MPALPRQSPEPGGDGAALVMPAQRKANLANARVRRSPAQRPATDSIQADRCDSFDCPLLCAASQGVDANAAEHHGR